MKNFEGQGNELATEKTPIALAAEQAISGESTDAEKIIEEIKYLREIISPYDKKDVDRKTYDFIEEISKKITILESRLTVVDTLKHLA